MTGPIKPNLCLASGSATRRTMLENAGLHFEVKNPDYDEGPLKQKARAEGWPAERLALHLAEAKAACIDQAEQWIIGADQVLECEGRWFEKARTPDDARQNLEALQGKPHELISAVCVRHKEIIVFAHSARAYLEMRALTHREQQDYLNKMGHDVFDSVGGYKLEGLGAGLMTRVEGDFFTILGLPLLPLLEALRDMGAIK